MRTAVLNKTRTRKALSWSTERAHWKKGIFSIMGIDEAGRGPLAGPVVAAAVYFDYETCRKCPLALRTLNDSKKLSPDERERLYDSILEHARSWGIGIVSSEEIDRLNILQATMKAMTIAVEEVTRKLTADHIIPELLLVDGNYFRTSLPYAYETVVHGDAKSPLIAAASILAKVTRDRIMLELDSVYPEYNFKAHKGYGTLEHLRLMKLHGACPEHRRSFRPERFMQGEFVFENE